MKFHQTIDENRKALRQVAALLCALAGLAERAAGRSRAVCFLVLWLLRPAETAARTYVEGLAPGAARFLAPEPLGQHAGPVEALRLAQIFRMLAAVLAMLADDGGEHRRGPPVHRRCATFAVPPLPAARPAGTLVPRLDTS